MSSNSKCFLCSNELFHENSHKNHPKLSQICCKYLQFAFTEETVQLSHDNLTFCPNCFESAIELVHLSEQVEYYQRRISELVSSLEILHRNWKIVDTDFKADINDFNSRTDCDDESQNITFNSVFIDNIDDSFPLLPNDENNEDVTIEEFKFETGTGEHQNNDEFVCMKASMDIRSSFNHEVDSKRSPILKLRRIQFLGIRKDIILVENDEGFSKSQKQIILIKNGTTGRYKVTDTNKTSSLSKNSADNLELLRNSPSSALGLNSTTISTAQHIFQQSRIRSGDLDYNTNTIVDGQISSPRKLTSENPLHKCVICQKEYKNRLRLVRHNKLVHQKIKSHCCKECGKRFKTKYALMTHIRRHTGERPYSCDVCSKTFINNSTLQTHKIIHTGERPYSCGVCSKTFVNKGTLLTHKKIHTGERPFSCEICSKTFVYRSNLVEHEITHTGVREKCDLCDSTFSRKKDMLRHRKTQHTEERWFKCRQCDYSCKEKWKLEAHRRRHTDEKTFKCSQCDYSCKHNWSLNKHKISHSKDKPFKCDDCDYACKTRTQLNRHILCHFKVKPKCDECGYTCRTNWHLVAHKRKHSGVPLKSFKCKDCNYTFSRIGHLERHRIRKHLSTAKNNFKCRECEKYFKFADGVRTHYSRVHFALDFSDDCIIKTS